MIDRNRQLLRATFAHVLNRPVRLVFALFLVLGLLGVNPISQPALAAPSAAPAAQPAGAPSSDLLPSPAPTVIVTTTSIADNPADGQCDLWEALQAVFQANFDLSPTYHECTALANTANVIGFSPATLGGTIQLPSTVDNGDLPFAWGDTTILGPITIKPSATNTDTHLLRTAGEANISLIAVTLSDAHTSGGGAAILDLNHATINLIGANIEGNVADNDGGAINSDGNVNVTLSNFSGNEALGMHSGTGYGGAINISGAGTLNIAKSNFAGNTAKAGGGALYSTTSSGTVADSLFSGNIGGQDINAHGGGGAIYNDVNAVTTVFRTQFAGNLSPQGSGGAIWNNAGASMAITDTTFAANLAGDPGHATLGGAIYDQEDLQVYRSSFVNNISVKGDGGALAVDSAGTATVANSTFAANTAPFGAGGAVVITQTQSGGPASTFLARNDTISLNGASNDQGGGLFNGAGQNLDLGNTIIASNVVENCAGDGNLNSAGHNLDSGTSCNLPNSNGNISNGSADLGGPSFNGGPLSSMLTMKPNYGSDAIDAGDGTICAGPLVGNLDQRSSKRPTDGTNPGNLNPICDIGAYEADGPSPSFAASPSEPGPIDVGSTEVGTTVTTTLVVSNTGDFLLTITPSALTGSNPGDFSVPLSIINILPGGPPVNIVISCTPSAVGSRSAAMAMATDDVPLHAAVGYLLKCNGSAAPVAGFSAAPIPPGPITFPDTIVGQTSSRTIKVFETGDAPLTVTDTVLSGANAADFNVLTGTPFSITNGGAAHNITVQCTPADVGLRTAKLTLTTNDSTQNPVSYYLSCQGEPQPSPFMVAGTSVGNSPDHGLAGVFGVAVSPTGKYVYSAGNTDGKVGSFKRDPISGLLSYISFVHDGFLGTLNSAILLAVSPDGNNAYVAGQADKIIDKLTADPATGAMSFIAPIGLYPRADLAGAHGVVVSPDGRSVYATGNISNSVVTFSRDLATGNLTYVQTVISATALGSTEGLAVSPDGQNVYVTGSVDGNHGTLEVFKRSTADGHLSPVQTRKQGDTLDGLSLDGMKGAYQVSVSPDGQNVYVVGDSSNAIVAFSRNPANGMLQWIATYTNGSSGITGLGTPLGIDTTPDGLHVIASGYNAQSVAVFDRDPDNGFLTFNQEIHRNGSGVPPLNGALDVRASPDSRNVYVASYLDNAIAVLQAANPVPEIDNINPAGVVQDTTNVIMTINGAGFLPGSIVKLGPLNLTPAYLNSQELQVDLSNYVHSPGVPQIEVYNPAPGGGFSNHVNFTVSPPAQNPVPSIDHITPQGSLAGGAALTVDVFGASFINGATVRWNGNNRSTTFINSGHLQASIPQSDVSQPGTSSVTVFNATPGGGLSNTVAFSVAQPGQNAVPSLSSLNPLWVFSYGAASKQLKITVTGQNFIQGSTVRFNGSSRPTLFVDSSHLTATLFSSDLAVPASTAITVFTPAPGGGASSALTFLIRKRYPLYVPFLKK